MAVVLSLSYEEQNDNKAIILQDTSTGLNVGAIATATLDVTVNKSDGTTDVKSQVDLKATFGPFVTQADMLYTITAAMLGDTAGSLLEDGVYDLEYKIDGDTLNVSVLVCGQIKVLVYDKLRLIPTNYMCNDARNKDNINEADLCGAYLSALEASDTSDKEKIASMLTVLQNIVLDGSGIIW